MENPPARGDGLPAYFVLANLITWTSTLPLTLSFLRQEAPPAWAMPLAGIGALGPTLAALAVAAPRKELGRVFGPWRTNPAWLVLALFLPLMVNTTARLIETVLGGQISDWWLSPIAPENWVALVMFSIGEEFGWRGFAQPRMMARFGAVKGPLILGVLWALWHLTMFVDPSTGSVNWPQVLVLFGYLPAFSVVYAWLSQVAGGSIAVAIALHMGGHLDNINNAPPDAMRLRVLVLAVTALLAFAVAKRVGAPQVSSGA